MSPVWIYPALLALLIYMPHTSNSHPQCLDFRPPFGSEKPLPFCPQYTKHGCCSAAQDRALARRHRGLLSRVSATAAADCSQKLAEFLCLECSPFAAHVFDSESDGVQAPLPGLCSRYCSSFYIACERVVPFLVQSAPGLPASPTLQESFCKAAETTDMDYCYPKVVESPLFNAELRDTASTVDGCLCLEEFARDLRNALSFEMFPDGSGRVLVSEQVGLIHVFHKNGSQLAEPFMDLTDRVLTSVWEGDERGLLGLTFHPQFKVNRKFYVYFSIVHDNKQKVRISEFKVSVENENKANMTYERILLQVHQPFWNHNGGEILFGLDGYLYIFLGDGGSAGDPGNRAQNRSVLLGKVLRVDIDVPEGSGAPYIIPPDNPYVTTSGARPEVFATGIRNTWRCDRDSGSRDTGYGLGRIICGDVGQSAFEEINIIEKGANYGWNSREGFDCFRQDICGRIGNETLPIYAYPHSVGKSVTGGHVYRGCMNPSLEGAYIYGDYVVGKLFKLVEDRDTGSWSNQALHMCGDELCFNGLVNKYEKHILSFGKDQDGEIYMLTTKNPVTTEASGKIYKLVDPRRRGDPASCRSYVPPPPYVTVTSAAASGLPLSVISWLLVTCILSMSLLPGRRYWYPDPRPQGQVGGQCNVVDVGKNVDPT